MTTAATKNGKATQTVAAAIASEETLREQAEVIRGEHDGTLDAVLLDALMPLLRTPIPAGFIVDTPAVKGKPYESRGVRAMQVQVNRMDAVLGVTNWGWETIWMDGGKLAEVTVWIGPKDAPLVRRVARGGVNQASTEGNLHKGSETNAGKLAFARVGPAWEIYVGAADLDPDVSPDAAKAQAERAGDVAEVKLPAERAEKLEAIVREAGLGDHLPAKLRGFGVKQMTDLTSEQAMGIWEWVQAAQGDQRPVDGGDQ